MTLRGAWLSLVASALLLDGCSLAGSLRFGDVTLGFQNGFTAMGSHAAFVID